MAAYRSLGAAAVDAAVVVGAAAAELAVAAAALAAAAARVAAFLGVPAASASQSGSAALANANVYGRFRQTSIRPFCVSRCKRVLLALWLLQVCVLTS